MASRKRGRVRVWPAAVILAGMILVTAAIWMGENSSEQIRQSQVTETGGVLVIGGLLLMLWLGLASGLERALRLRLVAGVLLLGGALVGLFRFRGVSGDLVPQFELRFRRASERIANSPEPLPGVEDYPQFQGPHRDARLTGLSLARDWERRPPRLVWRRPVGGGWAGFAVVGGSAVTQEQHSAEERVICYELATGKVLWASREVAHYRNPIAGDGPRSTPTVRDGRVYAMGATGLLTVIELDTGELSWKRDVLKDNGGELSTWGKSISPLVTEELVVVSAGGTEGRSLVAYHRDTGELVWHAGTDRSGYSSPMLVTLAGVAQIVSFNHSSVTGHDPETGELLWSRNWPPRQPNVAQPLVLPGDRLLVSAGYGIGSKMLRILRDEEGALLSEILWESPRLKSKFANIVWHEGFVYGLDDGILVCLDPGSGQRRWKRGRYGHGQLILVDDLLLIQGEHGEVVLVDPDPAEHRELTRFTAMTGKIWNPPALAGPYLLMRNDVEAVLYELPHGEAAFGPLDNPPEELS